FDFRIQLRRGLRARQSAAIPGVGPGVVLRYAVPVLERPAQMPLGFRMPCQGALLPKRYGAFGIGLSSETVVEEVAQIVERAQLAFVERLRPMQARLRIVLRSVGLYALVVGALLRKRRSTAKHTQRSHERKYSRCHVRA